MPANEVPTATEASLLRGRILPEGNSFFQHDAVSLWGAARATMNGHRPTADQHELDARIRELDEKIPKVVR